MNSWFETVPNKPQELIKLQSLFTQLLMF